MPRAVHFPVLATVLAASVFSAGAQAAGAAGCTGFKSGTYVALNANEPEPQWRAHVLQFDAATLVVTDAEGAKQLSASDSKCAFTTPDGNPLVVSKAGVFMARLASENAMIVGIPVQDVALGKLAGVWNYVRTERFDDQLFHTANGLVTIQRNGKLQAQQCTADGTDCGAPINVGVLTPHPQGGFDLVKSDSTISDRMFFLRNKDGQMMMAGVGMARAALTFAAPVQSLALPTVGDKSAIWDMSFGPNGLPSSLGSAELKILSVDAANSSYTRKRLSDCRRDSWTVNHLHVGMAFRRAGSFKRCDGSTGSFGNNLAMPLRSGFGISAYGWESTNDAEARFFGLSIQQP
jgi:hypothetical protein